MTATQRVIDSGGIPIGFLVDEEFYTDDIIRENIDTIDNLTLAKDGIQIQASCTLPSVAYAQAVNIRRYKRLTEENPFVRDIQKDLLRWKTEHTGTVLRLDGTRQVGKTTELLKFAYKNYNQVIYVNLAMDRYDFLEVIRKGQFAFSMNRYCKRAGLLPFVNKQDTLLIIDEIQLSFDAYNSIRDLRSALHCDIIVTGSYLGQTLKKEFFQPAGTVSSLSMHTLSFQEFCRIFGLEDTLLHIDLYGEGSPADYEKLYDLYDLYRKIGGYPEVVKTWLRCRDIRRCHEVLKNLLDIFEKESRNYFSSPKDAEIFSSVYQEAIREMCQEKRGSGKNSIETLTELTKKSSKSWITREEVSGAVMWLKYCSIIGCCHLASNGNINDIQYDRRIYFMDCGIASYIAGGTTLPQGTLEGLITETFVFNELYRLFHTFHEHPVVKGFLCFSIYNQYELDFMLTASDNIIYGLEVKTTAGNPRSLKMFIDRRFVDKGIVAKRTRGGHGDVFDTIPIFAVGARFPYR